MQGSTLFSFQLLLPTAVNKTPISTITRLSTHEVLTLVILSCPFYIFRLTLSINSCLSTNFVLVSDPWKQTLGEGDKYKHLIWKAVPWNREGNAMQTFGLPISGLDSLPFILLTTTRIIFLIYLIFYCLKSSMLFVIIFQV